MKNFKIFFIGILALTFCLEIFSAGKKKAESPVAIVMKIANEVQYKKADVNAWTNAKIGQTLINGDEIKTGAKALALIKFTDNSQIRVRENSSLKVYADKKGKEISKNTYIEKGKVGFEISRQQNEEFRFTTPTMVASIRGTEGYIQINPDGGSLLVVSHGSVYVIATQGLKQNGTVNGGNSASVSPNGEVQINAMTQLQQQQQQNIKSTTKKKMTIKTSVGEIIVEYYE